MIYRERGGGGGLFALVAMLTSSRSWEFLYQAGTGGNYHLAWNGGSVVLERLLIFFFSLLLYFQSRFIDSTLGGAMMEMKRDR